MIMNFCHNPNSSPTSTQPQLNSTDLDLTQKLHPTPPTKFNFNHKNLRITFNITYTTRSTFRTTITTITSSSKTTKTTTKTMKTAQNKLKTIG